MGVFHIQKNTVLVLDGVRMRIRKKVQQGSGNKWQLEETVSGSIQQMDEEELFRLLKSRSILALCHPVFRGAYSRFMPSWLHPFSSGSEWNSGALSHVNVRITP